MTHPDLDPWLVELARCPASAVEQPLLQKFYQQDPLFFTDLSLRQRWQLLVGLSITLLDYTSASFSPLGLETQHLRLPVRQLTLPLAQLMDALVSAEFELDQVAWIEELDVELSEQEQAACDQVLTTPESTALLHQLLSRGLAFLATCDLSEEDKVQQPVIARIDRDRGVTARGRLPNASDHLPAGASAKSLRWVQTPCVRGRWITSLAMLTWHQINCKEWKLISKAESHQLSPAFFMKTQARYFYSRRLTQKNLKKVKTSC